jgi:branched-chain amino acid transport system substrate-binding protein
LPRDGASATEKEAKPMPNRFLAPVRLVLNIAALAMLAGCNKNASTGGAAPQRNEIVVGEYGSLTGNKADFGITTDRGIQLATEQLNAVGGVLGKKVRVIAQDDQGNADQVATIVTRFVTSDKVDVVLGEVASSLSLRAAPICQDAKVPMITPSSTNPEVTLTRGKAADYIFRVCFIDPFQGTVMARFATNNLKAKKAAILRDTSNAYSVGLADYFVQEFKRLGGTITVDKSYSESDDNFRAQLTDIAGTQPDIIYVPGYYSEVSLIAKQAREAGIMVPLAGGDGWDSSSLISNAGTALEGCYFSNHYSEAQGGPVITKFVADFKAKYKVRPNALAALGYDAMNIYAAAVKAAGTTEPAKVIAALSSIKDFPGVTGKISMDQDHNAVKPAVVLQIKGKDFAYVTTVKP